MLGKVVYGAVFTLVLPALLILWARALSPGLNLPVVHWPVVGGGLGAVGAALMAMGMLALRVYGGGLPMNAFPPPRLVSRGVYRLTPHPIYVGFCIMWVGGSIAVGSVAGLWFISPVVMLGCAALVYGYEGPALRRRFGDRRADVLLRLPPGDEGRPGPRDLLGVAVLVFLPWLILYEAVGHIHPGDAAVAYMPFEARWPVLPWTEAVYGATYPFVLLAPLACRGQRSLRAFAVTALVGTGVGMLIYLIFPVIAPPKPFTPKGPLGRLLMLERADGLAGHAALPCFHVFWAMLAASVYAQRGGAAAVAAWAAAGLIAASCITTGMHALADLAAGGVLFVFAARSGLVWSWVRAGAERTANSWREVRIGPARIIGHGVYAGLAAYVGLAIVTSLLGREHLAAVAGCAMLALAGAAIWGQIVVGSASLLRPFGYYGAVIGACIGFVATGAAGADGWMIAAATAVAAPWTQAIGRMRCLVQGCCHGRETAHEWLGIRYTHPSSRVCRLAGLGGVAVHPTPVYSMAGNVVIGLIVARLWSVGAPATMIGGVYLLLSGLARFVEESCRGEPHTPVIGGLRLYQWLAMACVLIGAGITAVGWQGVLPPLRPTPAGLAVAALGGLVFGAAMGVDFPGSDRRFSRLA